MPVELSTGLHIIHIARIPQIGMLVRKDHNQHNDQESLKSQVNYNLCIFVKRGDPTSHTALTATAGSENCPLKLSTSQPSIGVENQFPRKNQIQKSGRFRNHHFCLYFELGCELGPSEAQAQNTSQNDDFGNGPIFVFDFFVESTCLALNKAGMCLVLMDNFSEPAVAVKVVCTVCPHSSDVIRNLLLVQLHIQNLSSQPNHISHFS